MKRFMLLGAALCLSAGIATTIYGTHGNLSQQESLLQANIEALAENEGLPVSVLLANCFWSSGSTCDVTYGGYIWGNSNMAPRN